jgi:CHAT domain-containing protein
MKSKIILPALVAVFGLLLFFLFRGKSEKHAVMQPVIIKTDDSLVFRQLMKIKTYQKADSLYNADAYDSAIHYFDKTFFNQTFINNPKIKQQILNRIGYTYILKVDYKNAAHYLGKAFQFTNEKDTDLVNVNTYEFIGTLYDYTNEPDSALYYLQRAYNMYIKRFGDKNLNFVKLGSCLGHIYQFGFNDYYNAEKYLYDALLIFERLGPSRNYDLYLNILYSLTLTTKLKKDYNKSLSYGLRILQLADSVKGGKRYMEVCNGLIGGIYLSLSDFKKSIEFYNKALEINSRSITPNRQYRVNWLNNLALDNYKIGNYKNAILYCNQSLIDIDGQNSDYINLATSFYYLGLANQELGRWSKALIYFRRSLDLRIKNLGTKNYFTSISYGALGNYYDAREEPDSALFYYQNALIAGSERFNSHDLNMNPLVSESKQNPILIEYLANKASVLKQKFTDNSQNTSFLVESLICYELADSLVSYSRKTMETEESKLSISINSNELYENAIDCAYQLYEVTRNDDYITQAFRFFEKNKYLLLLENLQSAEAAHKAGIPDSLVESERNLNVELKYSKGKLDEEQHKNNLNISRLQKINERVFTLMRKLERLYNVMAQKYPNYYRIKYQEPNIRLADLEAWSKEKKTSIIQYFWGQHSVYSISVDRNHISFWKIKNDTIIRNYLGRYIQLSHEVNLNFREKYLEYSIKAQYLYGLLLKGKIRPDGSNPGHLIIIPDGLLTKLSFEALVASPPKSTKFSYRNLDYLIYHCDVHYAYSSNILLSYHTGERKRYVDKVLGFGYSGNNLDDQKPSGNQNLPGTYQELKTVSRYFRCRLFLGKDATKENFKQNVSHYDILHLALHGVASEENENGSGLIFRADKNKHSNGYLYVNDIYNLGLNAKMTVLSACETGLGKDYKGEGVFSIARAFSYAGCPTVVLSLWNVNDRSTAELMGKFYKHLSNDEEIGMALRNAKLDYLRQSDEIGYQPVFWASFVAFGDMAPIQSRSFSIVWIVGSFSLIAGFIVFWKIRMKGRERKFNK